MYAKSGKCLYVDYPERNDWLSAIRLIENDHRSCGMAFSHWLSEYRDRKYQPGQYTGRTV